MMIALIISRAPVIVGCGRSLWWTERAIDNVYHWWRAAA